MKKILIALIGLFLFNINAFAFIDYKQSIDISSDATGLRQINFKPDGTIMYVTNREKDTTSEVDTVKQYSLSTPFDISTAKLSSSTFLTNIDKPHAIHFKPDGKVMYVVDNGDLTIEQYNLTTAWDTSTLVHDNRYEVQEEGQLRSLAFKPDGTTMYVTGNATEIVQQLTLSTPWDVSTAVEATKKKSSALTGKESNPRSIQFNSDGTIFYIGGGGSDSIHKYTLKTAWDIETLEFSQSYSFSAQVSSSGNSTMTGFIFTANFTKLYITQDTDTRQSQTGVNTIYEYSVACAGTITCSDPSGNSDVKAIIEAQVELSKRLIKHNTLPVFHRIEWLRRHKNKDNLSNLNAEINFTNEKVSKLVKGLKNFKKNNIGNLHNEDWFEWSEGRISLGRRSAGSSSSSKKIHSHGIAIGADKINDEDTDTMHGYVFQLTNDNVDIGSNGSKLDTNSYSLSMYGTKLRDDGMFSDGIIGLSILDINHKRVIYTNDLVGDRNGTQLFGSFNLGKRLNNEKINLNPGVKIDLGYTELDAYRENTVKSNSQADALIFKKQEILSGLATIGVLFDKTDKNNNEEKIINHHGRLEYILDFSPSSEAEFYYVNSQSTNYKLHVGNQKKNYRLGYGFDLTSINGWSIVTNFERYYSNGNGHSNEIYLSVGYVPIDEMKFALDLNNNESLKTGFNINKNIKGFIIKVNSNYNLISKTPDYKTSFEAKKIF